MNLIIYIITKMEKKHLLTEFDKILKKRIEQKEILKKELEIKHEENQKEKLIKEIVKLQRPRLEELDTNELKMVIEEFKK